MGPRRRRCCCGSRPGRASAARRRRAPPDCRDRHRCIRLPRHAGPRRKPPRGIVKLSDQSARSARGTAAFALTLPSGRPSPAARRGRSFRGYAGTDPRSSGAAADGNGRRSWRGMTGSAGSAAVTWIAASVALGGASADGSSALCCSGTGCYGAAHPAALPAARRHSCAGLWRHPTNFAQALRFSQPSTTCQCLQAA